MEQLTNRESVMLPIKKLHPFKDHPYMVRDDEEMAALTESIKESGILTPLIVRPVKNTEDEYEVVSGHRRLHAAQKAGLETVPAFVFDLDKNAATIVLVDSNLHREHILPSEKAFAYKMKLEAMKHQGKTSGQAGPKLTVERISEDDSASQVKRYIRLTNLIPKLLLLVDDGRIAMSNAVALSYLDAAAQRNVLDAITAEDCTPSYSQAIRLRNAFDAGTLDKDFARKILREEKANQKERVSFEADALRKFFPQGYSIANIQSTILKMLEERYAREQRSRDRDER